MSHLHEDPSSTKLRFDYGASKIKFLDKHGTLA